MKILISFITLLSLASVAEASVIEAIIQAFKDEEGNTKWQHVANFTGSVLILLLTFTLAGLLYSSYKLRLRNRELRDIKKNLEKTVDRRTENLNKSNRLLQQSNSALESEITEHKETSALLLSSQTYLQSILASMPSMLVGLDETLCITHWNKTAESITGLNGEAVAGKNLWDVYPAITVSVDQIKKVLETRQPLDVKHSQRGQYYFDIRVFPLTNDHSGVVVVIENVTQRSLAENMLIQRDKMASMGELASTMAHDINIPLQAILRDVQQVADSLTAIQGLDVEVVSLLEDAIARGAQASAVVSNLLEFSGSSAQQGSEKSPNSIISILDHCISLAGNMLSEPNGLHFRDIALIKDYMDNPPEIQCYTAELQQVFLSILRHANQAMSAKYAEDKTYQPGISISVSESFDALLVKIQHNGLGLTDAEQQDIFEPIVQHTTPINPKPLALENRLSFSYFIVKEHHNGDMAVTSSPEKGSTFHIQFQY